MPPKCRHNLAVPVEIVKGVFRHCIFQVIGRKVGVNHRHFNVCMAQNIAEDQYVSAVHHKMAGEGVAQHMSTLALWQIDTSPLNSTLKGFSTRCE